MEIKSTIVKTLKKHKFLIVLGTLLVGITIAASLSIPFITQYVIDEGITNKNVKLFNHIVEKSELLVANHDFFPILIKYIHIEDFIRQYTFELIIKTFQEISEIRNVFFFYYADYPY